MIRPGSYIVPLLLIFIINPLIYSCARKDTPSYGDTINVATHVKLAVINPVLTSSSLSVLLSEIIFDGLIRFDDKQEARPHLASSWEVLDGGTRYRFHLRRGILFHDGVEMTAEDVRFTIDKIIDPRYKSGPFSYGFKEVKGVEVIDRSTIDIVLGEPNTSFITNLTVGILPGHLLRNEDLQNTDFNYHPIGTGPFRLVNWSDNGALLEANRDYFLRRPYLDKVAVKVYKDFEASWAGLMKGDADLSFFLTPDNYNFIKNISEFKTYSLLNPHYNMIAFNLRNEIFKDKRVRQALNYAIDKEALVSKVLKGEGMVAKGTIYPGSWADDKELRPYPYNPKRALALLKEADWIDHDGDHFLDKDGKRFEFTLHLNKGDNIKEKAILMMQEELLDIGVMMKVERFSADSLDFLFQKKFDAIIIDLVALPDPDQSYRWWHSSQIDSGMNWFFHKNQEIDRLLDQGRRGLNIEERKAAYYKFQRKILDDPPGVFLFWPNSLLAMQKRFKGVKVTAAGIFDSLREWYVPEEEQRYR